MCDSCVRQSASSCQAARSSYCALNNTPLQAGYGSVDEGLEVACFQVLHVVVVHWVSRIASRQVCCQADDLRLNRAPTNFQTPHVQWHGLAQPVPSEHMDPSQPLDLLASLSSIWLVCT